MSERLLSGHSRLDGVLGGGLPVDAINMVIGLPGTGKTILAQQYLFANATLERPALYLATVSEPFEKILRYGQSLRFFDPEAVGHSVFYEDLGLALNERGLAGVLEQVTALIKERRPGIMVIDSFKALSAYAEAAEFRRFLHDFAGHLSAFPASSFWIGEYGEEEIAVAPEFAVADAIISLSTTRASERETRSLRVLKLRGSEFAPGQHAYRLSANGIDVFPRLADQIDMTELLARRRQALIRDRRPRRHARRRLLAGRLHALRRPLGLRQDADGPAFHLQRRPSGRTWCAGDAPGTPDPARADHRGVRVVGGRGGRRADVPLACRHVHRRVGLRPARGGGAHRRTPCPHRQPHRSQARLAGRDPVPRIHVLARPALLTPGSERVHDLGATRPLPRQATLRVRRLAPLRQRRAAPIHPRRSNRSARPHRSEDPREPTRTGNPRVQNHSRRDRAW